MTTNANAATKQNTAVTLHRALNRPKKQTIVNET